MPAEIAAALRLYVIVALLAVAEYVTEPAPWQRMDEAPNVNTGTVTGPFVVAVCEAVIGPLQPAAVAVIVAVPVKPAIYVTAPVAELIVKPAARLAASRL